jgi:hypothetical protein
MRDGYGLFIDGDCLNWQRDKEAAAERVFQGRTGHAPWDTREGVHRPKDLSEWRSQESTAFAARSKDDPLVIPLECSCGHAFGESVARIRSIQDLRCPSCKAVVRMDRDRLMELIAEARAKRAHSGRR